MLLKIIVLLTRLHNFVCDARRRCLAVPISLLTLVMKTEVFTALRVPVTTMSFEPIAFL